MKTVIKGFVEIKNGEFYRFGRNLSNWEGTSANSLGKIVPCKLTIEYEHPDKKETDGK